MEVNLHSVVLTVLIYILLPLVGLWCWFQWTHRHLIRAASKLPTVYPTLPIIGHAHYTIYGMIQLTEYILDAIDQSIAKGIPTFCFWCGPLPIIVVQGLDEIKKILNSSNTLDKADEYDYFKFAIGDGLLTAPGNDWKIKRKHISPLFHPRNVEMIMPNINKNCRKLVANLSEHVGRGPMDLFPNAMNTAIHSVINMMLGPDFEGLDEESNLFIGIVRLLQAAPNIWIKRITQVWLRIEPLFEFIYKKELQELEEVKTNIIEFAMETTKSVIGSIDENSYGPIESLMTGNDDEISQDFLSLPKIYENLINRYPRITVEDLKSEVLTLGGTGSDTIAATVSTCLLILAQYQDIQEKLFKEISSVIDPDDDITAQDILKMPYLEQVCKETLRWSSIVPFVLRKPTHDLHLKSCTIPAGSSILLCLRSPLMDPKTYPDPQRFDPDRFAPDNIQDIDMSTFLPFSGGPRNCVGKHFAEMQMKVMVCHVIRNLKLSTTMDINKMKRKLKVFLESADGFLVSLEHRP